MDRVLIVIIMLMEITFCVIIQSNLIFCRHCTHVINGPVVTPSLVIYAHFHSACGSRCGAAEATGRL